MSDIKDRYSYVSKVDDKWASLCISGGKFDGVIYNYGKVSVSEEENSDGTLPFKFEYDIVDSNGLTREYFKEDFYEIIGDILLDIVTDESNN